MRGKFKFGIHFKDLNTFGEVQNFKGVAYGTGVLNAKAMLQELDNQGFDGYFIIGKRTNLRRPRSRRQGLRGMVKK